MISGYSCKDGAFGGAAKGFGSLDERSRDQAVKVLQEMAEGSRLVGIISHVTELKQEIEDQLIVTRDEKGSQVKWKIS